MAILHYRDKVQISHEIWREFLSGSWKYWSNLRTPPSASFGGGARGEGRSYLRLYLVVLCLRSFCKFFTGLSDRWRQKGSTLSTSCVLYIFSFVRFPREVNNYYKLFSMEGSLGNNIVRK